MERRQSARIPLDTPCLVTLVTNYEDKQTVMVVDASEGGVQIALSPGASHGAIVPGVPVTFQGVPAPLDRHLEGAHGKVAWAGVRCCGVRLNRPLAISQADIADISRL